MGERSLLAEFEEHEDEDFYLAVHHCMKTELCRDMNVWLHVHNKTVDDFGLGDKAPREVMYTKWILSHPNVDLTDRIGLLIEKIRSARDEQHKLNMKQAIHYLVPDIEEYVDDDPEGGYDVYRMGENHIDGWYIFLLECCCCFKREANPKYIRMTTFPPDDKEHKNIYYI